MDILLEKILKSSVAELKLLIKEYINEIAYGKYEVFEDGDYIFFKLRGGENVRSIMFSCHIDTVHKELPTVIYEKDTLFGKELSAKEGIGGDDRAGVYALLKILERFKKYNDTLPKYLLFTDKEEVGCIGAKKFAKDFKIIENIGWVIELDAHKDIVEFYKDSDKNGLMLAFKFNFATKKNIHGSDMDILCDIFGSYGVNVGVGYDRYHKTNEVIYLDILNYQIMKISSLMIQHLKISKWINVNIKK